MADPILEVEDLHIGVRGVGSTTEIVRGVSFSVAPGEALGILGESGSGKTMTADAVMGLERDPVRVLSGQIRFDGTDLLNLPDRNRRRLLGVQMSMVFQDSLSALNPSFTVGWQIAEMYRVRGGLSRHEARDRTIELLGRVGIADPEVRFRHYPHQFSGGMRQRATIAMAVALSPRLLIADEPTTALDVTVQKQILDLLRDMQRDLGMALIIITHDLGVLADVADDVMVMYAGHKVEEGSVDVITREPRHPYTSGLLIAAPGLNIGSDRLTPIRGMPPEAGQIPGGCPFHPRCDYAVDACTVEVPSQSLVGGSHAVACIRHRELAERRHGEDLA